MYVAFFGCLGIIFYISFLEDKSLLYGIEIDEKQENIKETIHEKKKNGKDIEKDSKWDSMYYLCHHCKGKITKNDMMYCFLDHIYCSEMCRDEIIYLCKEFQKNIQNSVKIV